MCCGCIRTCFAGLGNCIQDAVTVGVGFNLFPVQGNREWDVYRSYGADGFNFNIAQAPAEQCQRIAEHIRSNISWERWKVAGLLVGGVALSAFMATCILVDCVALFYLTVIATEALYALAAGSIALKGLVIAGFVVAYLTECALASLGIIVFCGGVWNKLALPDLNKAFPYLRHLNEELCRVESFEARALGARALVQIGAGEEGADVG